MNTDIRQSKSQRKSTQKRQNLALKLEIASFEQKNVADQTREGIQKLKFCKTEKPKKKRNSKKEKTSKAGLKEDPREEVDDI